MLTSSLTRALVVILALVASGCGTAGTYDEPASAPPGRYAAPPPMTIDTSRTYRAIVVTTKGTFELSLDAKAAPRTVNNFVFLARDRFYDGLTFHRVEPGFVVQGGDPSGDGTGGPGYLIDDEASPLVHEDGALGMAKGAAPNSAGSQFYVTLGAQPGLDGRYTVFGRVATGMDVVRSVAKGDRITTITVEEL
jgi:peptidyl-prolyl cis-trans isomerase B (cyclophilin B)